MGELSTTLTSTEIATIGAKDDFHIAPLRVDGKTYGTPTWIWSVVVEGNLYVRAYHGIKSRWYQSAIKQKTGKIEAANMVKQIRFEPVTTVDINSKIDAAYRQKYSSSPYLGSMISDRAKAATIQILPLAY